jgi:predicted nuclease of predicted toxin-antitoxin system
MASFYTNENFPIKVAQYLRQMGHDVLTSHEAGKANQRIPDEEVLAFAAESGRILLTLNRWDFIVLHTKSTQHTGIMVCTQNPDLLQQAEQIDKAVTEAGNLKGILIRVNRG